MPLRCKRLDHDIYSYNLTQEEWDKLRIENNATSCLHTHCCDSEVVLKTSPLGTRYFAHKRKGKCATAPESKEHIEAKRQIVEGIQRTTWIAQSEEDGTTPDGNKWTADVLATKGTCKVAFEVQWTKQDDGETIRRQKRYRVSNVRGLWLFRQHDFISDKDTPAFQIRLDVKTGNFNVYMPSSKYRAEKAKGDPDCWLPSIPLQEFVEGCLTGRLIYAPAVGRSLPLVVDTTTITCKRCKKETNIITGLTLKVDDVLPLARSIHFSIYTEGIEPWIHKWLAPKLLRQHKIGRLKVRKSFLEVEKEKPYFSNGCFHCDGIQPRYFEDRIYEDEPTIKINVVVERELAGLFWARYVNYWWFDRK